MRHTLFSSLFSLSLSAAISHPFLLGEAAPTPSLRQTSASRPGDVIVQMFEWSWNSVAAECEAFLGPAGYGWVQTSPAQEHIAGDQWWTTYQPVSYNIGSRHGTRSEFADMVRRCAAVGVRVIADTVWNHMAAGDNGGTAGDQYDHYAYPAPGYGYSDFHHCGLEPGDDIRDYNNRAEVQTCELLDLADLATDTDHVQSTLAAYGNDLISLGVQGLRLDASKHIASSDLSNILGRLVGRPYVTQEVIWGAGEPIQPNEYSGNGDVQEFRYTTLLRDAFSGSGAAHPADLQNLPRDGWVQSANVFVANHDTERNGGSLNYRNGAAYTLATVFSLAHPYGRPTVLSSYDFPNTDAGAPNNGQGSCSGDGGVNGWLCQHRYPAIAGLTSFRNTVGSSPLTNWASPSSTRIAFSRGSLGFVAINAAGDGDWADTFHTGLPAGKYCDVVQGAMVGGKCRGDTFVVAADGTIQATVRANSALALHVGARA